MGAIDWDGCKNAKEEGVGDNIAGGADSGIADGDDTKVVGSMTMYALGVGC